MRPAADSAFFFTFENNPHCISRQSRDESIRIMTVNIDISPITPTCIRVYKVVSYDYLIIFPMPSLFLKICFNAVNRTLL